MKVMEKVVCYRPSIAQKCLNNKKWKEKANYRIGVFYMLLVVWIVELGNSLRILDYLHSNVP
jgi:hypothetical protein